MKSVTYGQTIKQASFQVLPASGFHIIIGGVRSGHGQSRGGREGGKREEGKLGAHVCPPGAPGSG